MIIRTGDQSGRTRWEVPSVAGTVCFGLDARWLKVEFTQHGGDDTSPAGFYVDWVGDERRV